MDKKYEITIIPHPVKHNLRRIRALKYIPGNDMVPEVKIGDLGGYVQTKHNLSQDGRCWIYNDAMVYDNAVIVGGAIVANNSQVYENALIENYAAILHYSQVKGFSRVAGFSIIDGGSIIEGDVGIWGNSKVIGMSKLSGLGRLDDIVIDDMKINFGVDFKYIRNKKSYAGITQQVVDQLKLDWQACPLNSYLIPYKDRIGNDSDDKEHIKAHDKILKTFLDKDEWIQNTVAKFSNAPKYKMLELRI